MPAAHYIQIKTDVFVRNIGNLLTLMSDHGNRVRQFCQDCAEEATIWSMRLITSSAASSMESYCLYAIF